MKARKALSVTLVAAVFVLGCDNPDDPSTSANGGTGAVGGGQEPPHVGGAGGATPGGSGGLAATGGNAGSGGFAGTTATFGGSGGSGASSNDGGSNDGDATNQAGGSGYDPCPEEGPCVVMPLGDSITVGADGGWRTVMFHLALVDSKSLAFVGSETYGQPETIDGVTFTKGHEGHSGYCIDASDDCFGISGLTLNAVQTFAPDIVALMIGTNDINLDQDLENAPARLGTLMDIILDADPALLLIVAQITPTKDDTQNLAVQAYNAAIPDLVATRTGQGKHVTMIDMYEAFTSDANYKATYMGDKLHPNTAGYARMAEVWYQAIGRLLR